MATAAISPTSGVTASPTASLSLNDLLNVLLTELTHQDPLKPMDNTQFMAQIAQFTSLDATQQMNQGVQQLVALQAIGQTSSLIGRTVSAVLDSGQTISGRVIALSLANGTAQMTVETADGTDHTGISISQITTIR
jgi:flagellar basal-body rod modification protein FlgD